MIRLTPVVKNIIILNVVIFLIFFMGPAIAKMIGGEMLARELEFNLLKLMMWKSEAIIDRGPGFASENLPFLPFQVVTGFLSHMDIFHILFNMLALFFIGVPIENTIGSRRFAKFYIFCGVISGLIIVFLDPSNNPVLGASTAISGILAAFGIMHPDAKISLIFLPPIPAKHLFLGAATISAFLTMLQMTGSSAVEMGRVSHFGHLAGMLAGALFFFLEKYIPFLRN